MGMPLSDGGASQGMAQGSRWGRERCKAKCVHEHFTGARIFERMEPAVGACAGRRGSKMRPIIREENLSTDQHPFGQKRLMRGILLASPSLKETLAAPSERECPSPQKNVCNQEKWGIIYLLVAHVMLEAGSIQDYLIVVCE